MTPDGPSRTSYYFNHLVILYEDDIMMRSAIFQIFFWTDTTLAL